MGAPEGEPGPPPGETGPASAGPREPLDYAPLDRASAMIFYPRRDDSPAPPGALDLEIPVSGGDVLGARFHPGGPDAPSLLLFHGNGEVVSDYDGLAADYARAGAGLLVADFRGYGRSSGTPSLSTMIGDARACFEYAARALPERGYAAPSFVKGRSLGTHCALEVAAHFARSLDGLIIESGSGELARLAELFDIDTGAAEVGKLLRAHTEKIRGLRLPLLTIHGEWDELIPLESARATFDLIGSASKQFVAIPGAGHNDLLWRGRSAYFEALGLFLARHRPA